MEERVLKINAKKECIVNDIEIRKPDFNIGKILTKLDNFVNVFLSVCLLFGIFWIAGCADNGAIQDMIPGFIAWSFIALDIALSKLLHTKYGRRLISKLKIKMRKGR